MVEEATFISIESESTSTRPIPFPSWMELGVWTCVGSDRSVEKFWSFPRKKESK